MPVKPGDTISARVMVVGHRVTLKLNNRTRHRSFVKRLAAPRVDVRSAEWIVEAPSECINISTCQTLPLANFGTARFNGATAQGSKGHLATIAPAPWSNTKIVLTPSGRRFVTFAGSGSTGGAALPSGLSAGGSAFTVTFSSQSNPFMSIRSAAAPSVVPPGRLYH
jgi:hypothetical protein